MNLISCLRRFRGERERGLVIRMQYIRRENLVKGLGVHKQARAGEDFVGGISSLSKLRGETQRTSLYRSVEAADDIISEF